MRKVVFLCIVALVGVMSCKPTINVVPLKDSNYQIKRNGFIYALPRAVFEIEVSVERHIFTSGPYADYSEKYLGITNVRNQDEEFYEISSITMNQIYEPDPDGVFLIDADVSKLKFSLNLNADGIITGLNTGSSAIADNDDVNTKTVEFETAHPENDIWFTDLSVKRNFADIQDTTYRVVKTDSVYQKIPVINSKITSKDVEQKADEAANFIFKLRKRRFKLETAQTEVVPEGSSIESMIKNLNDLESRYLELFIGKESIHCYKYRIYYIPGKNSENTVLFWLDDENGLSLTKNDEAKAFTMQLTNLELTGEVSRYYKRQAELLPKRCGLYYRIPGKAKLNIVDDSKSYFSGIYDVPQMGYLNYLDVKMMNKKNLSVWFDPRLGSIRMLK